jgi:hypothetical protein
MKIIFLSLCASLLFINSKLFARSVSEIDARIRESCPGAIAWKAAHEAALAQSQENRRLKKASLPALAEELNAMAKKDEDAREAWEREGLDPESLARSHVAEVDQENLRRLRLIVERHGFPTEDLVGPEAVAAAWILTQHADSDPEFQKKVLRLLATSGNVHGVSKQQQAFLTDRVQVNQQQLQTYGTQFKKTDKGFVAHDVADPSNLNKRRAEMGLMPMDDYQCVLRASFGS